MTKQITVRIRRWSYLDAVAAYFVMGWPSTLSIDDLDKVRPCLEQEKLVLPVDCEKSWSPTNNANHALHLVRMLGSMPAQLTCFITIGACENHVAARFTSVPAAPHPVRELIDHPIYTELAPSPSYPEFIGGEAQRPHDQLLVAVTLAACRAVGLTIEVES